MRSESGESLAYLAVLSVCSSVVLKTFPGSGAGVLASVAFGGVPVYLYALARVTGGRNGEIRLGRASVLDRKGTALAATVFPGLCATFPLVSAALSPSNPVFRQLVGFVAGVATIVSTGLLARPYGFRISRQLTDLRESV